MKQPKLRLTETDKIYRDRFCAEIVRRCRTHGCNIPRLKTINRVLMAARIIRDNLTDPGLRARAQIAMLTCRDFARNCGGRATERNGVVNLEWQTYQGDDAYPDMCVPVFDDAPPRERADKPLTRRKGSLLRHRMREKRESAALK